MPSQPVKLTQACLIMIDTETTHQDNPRVIELAGLEWIHGRPIRNEHFKETFVDPQCKIHPASMAIHHITDEDVAGAPVLEDIDQEWNEWVADRPLVAYNSDYDKGVLSSTTLGSKLWLDAYRMAMHVWSLGSLNEDGFPLTSFKQQELRYWLKLPPTTGDAHRAAADIQVTGHLVDRVIAAYLECGNPDDLQSFIDYVNSPIIHATLPIGGAPYAGKTPQEVEDWALRKAFDPSGYMFEAFQKFNVHECLLPEYLKRFGHHPNEQKTYAPRKTSLPAPKSQAAPQEPSAPTAPQGSLASFQPRQTTTPPTTTAPTDTPTKRRWART